MRPAVRHLEAAGGGAAARFPPIGDYALIGDCGSAALVARNGAVEWLCWPDFGSGSLFAAILDRERGGAFEVGPTSAARVHRRYLDGSVVLETRFETATGELRLRDCLAATAKGGSDVLRPEHLLLREISCVRGEVEVAVRCAPRFDYGRRAAAARDRGPHGVFFSDRGAVVVLRSELPLTLRDGAAGGTARLRAGQRARIALAFGRGEPVALPLLGEEADRAFDDTLAFWREWSARCAYEGPFRPHVLRSALTLKLLTAASYGAIVAAPTTSLPEKIGGVRNWDYRYCWLRDACFTLRALFELGYMEEGGAFFAWLLHTAHESRTRLRVLYTVMGDSPGRERELQGLEGYRGSRPVRIGNAAENQLQLDLYGELTAAAYEYVRRGGRLGPSSARLIARLGERVCALWQRPDHGIWERRGDPARHVHSMALCWVALDRLLAMARDGHLCAPASRFARVRDDIRDAIEQRGRSCGTYTSLFDGETVDSSLLLLALYGYVAADDPVMAATYRRIRRELAHDGLFRRYRSDTEDGLPPGEGAFGICSFWSVEYLARVGRIEQAEDDLARLCALSNDVGLFAEEFDPRDGSALGNFPQAFTHVGLINAALAIAEARGTRPRADVARQGPVPPRGERPQAAERADEL
jgi:GH15 family glucan-1,4-alpha-glucosidase